MKEDSVIDVKTVFPKMGQQESQFEEMYRRMAAGFGITQCEMWIYYFLLLGGEGVTQQTISSQMRYPKQTVNSAVAKLVRSGMVAIADGAGRSKVLSLTPQGQAFANATVRRLVEAELRAAERFGSRKLATLYRLSGEYLQALQKEFDNSLLS